MRNSKVTFITQAAVIAAIYTLLVILFAPISFGPIQTRVAEALTILPYFTPAAIPGVTIGCFLSAILTPTGADILDIIFGPIATLIGAILSYYLRRNKFLVPIPPILSNTIIIPWVIKYAYGEAQPIPFMMLTVGLGEILTAGIMGMILLFALERVKPYIFRSDNE